jgi:putative DNA primase/helicase
MVDLAMKDEEVRATAVREKMEEAEAEFSAAGGTAPAGFSADTLPGDKMLGLPEVPKYTPETDAEGPLWVKQLKIDKTGEIKSDVHNILHILRNDPNLRGIFAFNAFTGMPVVLADAPWRAIDSDYPRGRLYEDTDAASLRTYLDVVYGISCASKVKDALVVVAMENQFHPVRNYLSGLAWDGQLRLDTLLVDYFGCENTPYMRAATRKWFVAAVARVMNPGIKFDNALTLIGVEGTYKSTFYKILGHPWFTDNFSFHMIATKQAAEQIRGKWIVEIGELKGMKKTELESIKGFLSL